MTSRFAPHPWRIVETDPRPEDRVRNETIFSLANGHLGLRGNVEERAGVGTPGTYVNGFYEASPISYGEGAHALARVHQVMLNVADGKRMEAEIDGYPLDLLTGTVLAYERSLDLRTGIVERLIRWRCPSDAVVEIRSRRLVSLSRAPVAALELSVRAVEGDPVVRVLSSLDPTTRNQAQGSDPRFGANLPADALAVADQAEDGLGGHLVQRTRSTNLELAVAVEHELRSDEQAMTTATTLGPTGLVLVVKGTLPEGEAVVLAKTLAYVTDGEAGDARLARARQAARDAIEAGFERLAEEQRRALDAFWAVADIEITGDDGMQQGVRFNLFSVFQAAGRDGRTGLSAKGLTGEGYDGHYFWDTEIFALPFLAYAQPEIARSLLAFRRWTLPQAVARAAEMDERGALFPWRTIGGEEASAYFPAGTAQYHINADIAYAIGHYVDVTGDRSFLLDGGADVVIETARLWLSLGARIAAKGDDFCINMVTGPDEYSALVNNNLYTNVMARFHLRFACRLAEQLRTEAPDAWADLGIRLGVTDEEVATWADAADGMRVPYDAALGIHLQDDEFLALEPWDLATTPAHKRPLLLHFHPLVIYRHQVLKQPDVVLAQILLSEEFSLADKRRNFAFYDPLTTADSSLGACMQAVAAVELGARRRAYEYFLRTARMDLDDIQGNVDHGVHIAAMAGTWFAVVYGFAGLRDAGGDPSFTPRLPAPWAGLRFRLRIRGRVLEAALTQDEARYALLEGDPLEIRHLGRRLRLVAGGAPETASLRPSLEAVIFDLDGVLTDTAELHYRSWQRLADEEGLAFDRGVNERLRGIGRLDSLRLILEHAGTTRSQREMAAMADRKNGYYRDAIGALTPGDLLPGIADLLRDLRAAGIRTALASASHNAPAVIAALGIRPWIDHVVDAAAVVRGKPDPEVFLCAAEALRVRVEDCLGVEDAQAGVEAIRSAGMVAVGVGRVTGADWTVADTTELTPGALRDAFERARAVAAEA